jgi:hypothetical protein
MSPVTFSLSLIMALAACAEQGPPPPPATPTSVGMNAVADPLEARRKLLQDSLREMVDDLGAAGRYDCCVEAPCTQCAMRVGGCKCGEGLRRGEPVCEECALMWRVGRGAEVGVDPNSVRSFLEAAREQEAAARGQPAAPAAGCACAEGAPAEPINAPR